MKFKKGDTVLVTSGKDKGKKATISKVLPKKNKVVVEGVNMYVRHMKPFGGQDGQRVRRERPMDLAKIAIWNPETKKPDRIGYSFEGKGKNKKKVRIFKKTGKVIDKN